jgi:peptidoglycan/LPS O-acetylase OafA/YrhL
MAVRWLAGALLALWAYDRRPGSHLRGSSVAPHLGQALALSGLVVTTTSAPDLGPAPRGIAATACTVVLLWSLELAPAGIAARMLSWPIPAISGGSPTGSSSSPTGTGG